MPSYSFLPTNKAYQEVKLNICKCIHLAAMKLGSDDRLMINTSYFGQHKSRQKKRENDALLSISQFSGVKLSMTPCMKFYA